MSDAFWLLLLIPIAAAIVSKFVFKHEMHVLELLGVVALGGLIIGVVLFASYRSQLSDVEVLNGQVTGKQYEDVQCAHSYSCNCTTNKDGSTTCSTCYYHAFDRDWQVDSSAGSFVIERVDWQGLDEPKRWSQVKIGEPASRPHTYLNYVLGAKNSLFSDNELKPSTTYTSPGYPSVYDYYRIDRVINAGVAGLDPKTLATWNAELNDTLRTMGPSNQVNLNIVVTNAARDYGPFLERAWLGGKKNDVTVVIGSKSWPTVDWVYVFTFAKSSGNELLAVELRQALLQPLALADTNVATQTITKAVQLRFKRKPMQNFEYLADEVVPGVVAILLSITLSLGGCGILIHVFSNNELRH